MKQPILVCVVLMAISLPRLSFATPPGVRYLEAYFLIQAGDDAEAIGDSSRAHTKYSAALKVLTALKADLPKWQPALVEFRTKYCNDHLAGVSTKLPVAPVPPSPPDQVQQLRVELQTARDGVKKLTENRDELAARLQARLKEPAPTDRATAQQTLDELRSLRTTNETVSAKLERAQAKAARADQLEADLQRLQEKIQGLETERSGLDSKLQDALQKLSAATSSPQVEELLKKNADLTSQLATSQAEISKMRDELTAAGAPATDTVKLRDDIGQLQTELQQTKAVVAQRTEELEKLRSENDRLTKSNDEILARLNESDRQLRAAKASTDKDNEIIQQLRKENSLLRQVAGKTSTETREAQAKPQGGFLWFKPRPQPTPEAAALGSESAVSQSEAGKLTAVVKAPTPPESPRAPVPAQPAVRAESSDARRLLDDARAAIAQQDLTGAAAKFQAVLEKDPNNTTALSNLGVVYYKLNRLDEAEDTLHKAVASAPNDSEARSVLGVICFRKGRTEDAFSELTRAVALNPRSAEAHNYLGIVMGEKGWGTAAEQEVRRAIELNPEYADAHFNLAVIYARQKTPRLELARYHYQRARDLGAERDTQLEASLGSASPPVKQ